MLDRRVLRDRLAAPALDAQQADARRELAHDVVGAVGRAVRGDDHLELLGRVVGREAFLELATDVALLVVAAMMSDTSGVCGARATGLLRSAATSPSTIG